MKKKIFEDFLINKLNGFYLLSYGHDYYYTSELIFMFTESIVAFLVFAHIITPRFQHR